MVSLQPKLFDAMVGFKTIFLIASVCAIAKSDPSAVDVAKEIYQSCLQYFSVSCVKPKALEWVNNVGDKPVIRITDDLDLVKKSHPYQNEEQRGAMQDIFDKFEDFLQSHELVAKVPAIFRPEGPLGRFVPRSLQPRDVSVPLAATGRSSKLVKKVILPFLLGLKFNTAILVPLALALIALKSWKALTLGLLSFVLTGALMIFKLSKPKVVNYEVIHYPHHVEQHVEHPPQTGWDNPGYGRELSAQEIAYNAYLN